MRVTVKGFAYGREFDYDCSILSKTDKKLVLKTNGQHQHEIEVVPRHEGCELGTPETPENTTVCNFAFDGKFVAIAYYHQTDDLISIIPTDY